MPAHDLPPTTAALLAPFGKLYKLIVQTRLALYRQGALRTYAVPVPVISIGNITTGGTGKTPLVAHLARLVHQELNCEDKACVCVLSRGYGRANARARVLVSDGAHLLADARTGGDEPCELALRLRSIAAVISDADRYGAARWAADNLGTRAFILDDGFQHLRLQRDLDVLTIDATNPFDNEAMLPSGRLREPLTSIARANLIIITRADQAANFDVLRSRIEQHSRGTPILFARTRTIEVRRLNEMSANQQHFKESPNDQSIVPEIAVVAFCALGNPQAFFAYLRREGWQLRATRAFVDHHAYTQRDLDRLVQLAQHSGAQALVTTMKDAVKLMQLRCALPCYVPSIETEIEDEETLRLLVRNTLQKVVDNE